MPGKIQECCCGSLIARPIPSLVNVVHVNDYALSRPHQ